MRRSTNVLHTYQRPIDTGLLFDGLPLGNLTFSAATKKRERKITRIQPQRSLESAPQERVFLKKEE